MFPLLDTSVQYLVFTIFLNTLLFQKEEFILVPFSIRREGTFQIQPQDSIALTWFHLLRMTLEQLNGHATLKQLYQELRDHPKAKKNKNYEARIRATLYEHADCFLPLLML